MSLFWLSFADPDMPRGAQFLGVSIVEAWDFRSAIERAHELGANPGGEVRGLELPPIADARIPESFRNRLLTLAECEFLDRPPEGDA